MLAGSVEVATDGTVTKSGAAGEAYDSIVASLAAGVPPFTLPNSTAGTAIKRQIAAQANAIATAVAHVLANGHAKIATTDAALQRTPNPNDPDAATQGPAADKFLVLV